MRSLFALLATVLLVLTTPGLVVAQEASPTASPAVIPPPLTQWAAAVNSGDVDAVLSLFTEDGVWEEVAIGLVASGPDEMGAHLDRLFTAVPDITFDVSNGFV